MPRRSDEAFVLTRYPFRERDLIVVALTRQQGVVRLVARRARGPRAPVAARLETLSLVRVSYFERLASELATLDEVALVRSAFPLASRPVAWGAGQVLAELALLFSPPGQRVEATFRLLDRCIAVLLEGHDPRAVVDYACVWSVRLAGILPELERCGVCGERLPETAARYDPTTQTLQCPSHPPAAGLVTLSWRGRCWLREALTRPPEQVGAGAPADVGEWVERLCRAFTERELAALGTFHRLVQGASEG